MLKKSTFLHQIQQVPASGLSDGSSKDPGRGEHVEMSLRHPMLWENMSKLSCHRTAFNKEGKSIARRDYLRQAEWNSIWRCADSTVWSFKNILAPLHCYFFSDCLRCGIGFLLSTSSIGLSCRATLPSQPKTNQESVLLATTSSSLLVLLRAFAIQIWPGSRTSISVRRVDVTTLPVLGLENLHSNM